MAHEEEKKDDSRMYVVSGLFFICILAGGSCLALYIKLPETTWTIWYAIIGMVLVGIPWTFWFLICVYRCCTYPVPVNERRLSSNKMEAPAQIVVARTSGTATGTSNSPIDSPAGRHVRFGAATVVGAQDSNSAEDIDVVTIETESENSHDGPEEHHGAETSLSSAHESEQPLTFSILS
ncbi:hypothetical protein NE237_026956 [Protea cynaroides]|uniref:Uncharacterized protein n=1 Tax=Protea cynaroides TaxID=273540 RepID=A0A9Q0GQX4_9MAGN|nr:hypothetical protein NE237_026956 [Protea cynaroides]